MNARMLFAGILLMTSVTFAADDDRFRELVPADAKLEKLGTGMKFTEGPVWTDADGGYLIFSDIPASELKKWTKAKGVETFRRDANNTNGNTRDAQGRLVSCEHAARRVTRTEEDGKVTVLAEGYGGKRLNSPNDAVVRSDGSIWFTDPTYGLPRDQKPELDARHVFCFGSEGVVDTVVSDFDMPNGLCFSPDEKRLYVADSGKPRHIRAFLVRQLAADALTRRPTWIVQEEGVFCTIDKGVPDGIRCDERGNVWSSAGDGVQVFGSDGKLIGRIPVPESPANLCFGGEDRKTLFITARTSLYAIKTNVKGASRPQ